MIPLTPSPIIAKDFNFTGINDLIEDNLSLSSNDELFYTRLFLSEKDDKSLFSLGDEKKEEKESKNGKMFEIELCKKKRGRKLNKESKKQEHSSLSPDNVTRKIHNHFMNFLVSFANDCLNTLFPGKKIFLLKFDYNKKAIVSKNHFEIIKKFSIKEIFEYMGISNKYKKYEVNNNIKYLDKLNEIDLFHQFFEKSYLNLFSLYYNDGKPLNKLSIFGTIVVFSEKTKSFYHLLLKNKKHESNLINGAKNFFLADYEAIESE